MLLRILFIALLLYLVWRGLRSLALDAATRHRMPRSGPEAGSSTSVSDELVACDRCGVRVPAGRVERHGDHRYCSRDCRLGATGR